MEHSAATLPTIPDDVDNSVNSVNSLATSTITSTPALNLLLDNELLSVDACSTSTRTFDAITVVDDKGDSLRLRIQRNGTGDIGGHYMRITFTAMQQLREADLRSRHTSAVLFWLCEHLQTENIVRPYTTRKIAADCKTYATKVCQALRELERIGMIRRAGNGRVDMNPRYCFYGSTERQRVCCQEWDRAVELAVELGSRAKTEL